MRGRPHLNFYTVSAATAVAASTASVFLAAACGKKSHAAADIQKPGPARAAVCAKAGGIYRGAAAATFRPCRTRGAERPAAFAITAVTLHASARIAFRAPIRIVISVAAASVTKFRTHFIYLLCELSPQTFSRLRIIHHMPERRRATQYLKGGHAPAFRDLIT